MESMFEGYPFTFVMNDKDDTVYNIVNFIK